MYVAVEVAWRLIASFASGLSSPYSQKEKASLSRRLFYGKRVAF
jgi:hypothetical protein